MNDFALSALCFVFFICSTGCLGVDASTDILLQNHKLIGTSVSTQGFTLVLTDLTKDYTKSLKEQEINASLLTLNQRFKSAGYGFDGMRVIDILPSQTKLKVKQVYRSEPSLSASAFSGDTYFAVVEDNKGKQYTALVLVYKDVIEPSVPDEIPLKDCDNKECRNWKNPLASIMQSKTTKHNISLEYYITDTIGQKRSGANLVDYLMKKNISIIDNNKQHPQILIQVDFLEYGNLILHSDPLGIKNVGIWE